MLRGVSKEIVSLSQEPPEGIRLINCDDMTDIQAIISGPGKVFSIDFQLSEYLIH